MVPNKRISRAVQRRGAVTKAMRRDSRIDTVSLIVRPRRLARTESGTRPKCFSSTVVHARPRLFAVARFTLMPIQEFQTAWHNLKRSKPAVEIISTLRRGAAVSVRCRAGVVNERSARAGYPPARAMEQSPFRVCIGLRLLFV